MIGLGCTQQKIDQVYIEGLAHIMPAVPKSSVDPVNCQQLPTNFHHRLG